MRSAFLVMVIVGTLAFGADSRHVHAQPAGEPGTVSGQSVIGQDERVRITDTAAFPYSAIAYLELEDSDGQVLGSCTATLIGPDALLTAGHCLWDFEAEDWVESEIRVVPGKDGDFEPFGFEYAADWWVPDPYVDTGSSEWDWGVIKLPDAVLSTETGWLTVAVLDTETLSAPGFEPVIVGYPADKPHATMWGLVRPAFLAVEDFTLYYDIDTAPGQSGSAIWSAAAGPNLGKVVGIHSQGGSVNSGSRIDQELLDEVLEGCRVMECTIATDETRGPGGPELPYKSYAVAVARD